MAIIRAIERGRAMLKSCNACGKIHDEKYKCEQKLEREKKRGAKKLTQVERFRWSKNWKCTAGTIKDRDLNMCRVCLTNEYDTRDRFTTRDLSVHHIEPLIEAWDMRLDDDNLITLCRVHHELAECGKIPRAWLHELAVADVRRWVRV